jgi:hypothetical protein
MYLVCTNIDVFDHNKDNMPSISMCLVEIFYHETYRTHSSSPQSLKGHLQSLAR